jgi:ABC-type branched-subunit amino acid transport system substrate-binding protein
MHVQRTVVSALAAVAIVAGCGSSASTPTTNPTTVPSSQSTVPSSQPSVAATITPVTVKVGLLFPFSGAAASYGKLFEGAVTAGIAAVKEHFGSVITVVPVDSDSQNSAQGAQTGMTALATIDNVTIALTSGTAPGLAAMPIAKQYSIPLFNGSAIDPKLADASGWVFNLAPLANAQVPPLINYVVKAKNQTRIGIVHTTDALGTLLDAQLTSAVPAAGGQIVLDQSIDPALTDFASTAALMSAAKPDAIYLADSVGAVQYAPIFTQFRNAGITATFLGFNALDVPQVTSLAGVEGSLCTDQILNLADTGWATTGFMKAWTAANGTTQPNAQVVNYANAILIIAQAIDSLQHKGQQVTSTSLQAEMHAASSYDIIGGTVKFAADGSTSLQLGIWMLDGAAKSHLVLTITGS